MMNEARKPLDFGGLDDFDLPAPKARVQKPIQVTKKAVDLAATFPSREAEDDIQINIKASSDIVDRFRAMSKAERYKYGEFLQILMDAYSKKR